MIYEPSSMRLVPGQAPVFYPVSFDPSSVGLDLPIGSLVAYGAVRYVKWGTVATDWSIFGAPANRALQTVTLLAGAATITVSGLLCNSRDYLIVPRLTATVDGSTVTASLTGVGAADQYNGLNGESLLGSSLDFDTLIGTLGAIYGYTVGSMVVRAKAGATRNLNHDWNGLIAGRYFRFWGGARWATTTGEATGLTLTISAGSFAAGSSLTVYDAGVSAT